jgi:hypothetical protein
VRISDIAQPVPATGTRPAARKAGEGPASAPARSDAAARGTSPDEVAEVALQRASAHAAAVRVVAAQNELAAASASERRLTVDLLPT